MKGKNKLMRSCLAGFLCACLLASCMGNMTVAFAGKWDEIPAGKTVRYVSLGDSMTNGLGLPGYKNGGYLEVAPDAYPAQVAEHYGWELTQLATSGMRAEDLHYILMYGEEGGYPGDPWMEKELLDNGRWSDVEEVAATFKTAIEQADVITSAVGNANFSVFMTGMINAILSGDDEGMDYSFATKENGLAGLDPQITELVMQIHDNVMAYLVEIVPEEMVQKLGDAVIFTAASYMRNYNRALDRIVELNPDVEIVLYGLFNTESGFEMDIVYNGVTRHLSLADLREMLVQPINTYLAGWGTLKQGRPGYENVKIYYAEAEPVKTLSPTYKEIYKNDESVIRDRFVTDIVETIFPMVEMKLVDITLDDVKAYEAAVEEGIPAFLAYEQQAEGKAMSVAVYLALEGAILNSLDESVFIDLDELKELSDGTLDEDSFSGLMSNVTAELQQLVWENATEKMDEIYAALPEADDATVARIALLYATTEFVQAAFENDEMTIALLSLYGHTALGSGMSSHPDQIGHDQMTEAVIEAYTGEHTPTDAAIDKVLQTMKMLKTLRDAPDGPGKHGEYVIYEDSYYLAIDELYVDDASYADKVAAELGVPYKKMAALDEAEVAKADLITVRYNNEPMVGQMIKDAKNYKKVQPKDWTAYVGEEGATFVQSALAKVEETIAQMDLPKSMKSMVMAAVESYAYECTGHMLGYLKDLKAIAEINPDALVVSVSMNNSLEDVVLVMGEQEMALGKYIGYVMEAANMEAYAYVLMSGSAVYVNANDVATDYDASANTEAMAFILSLIDEEHREVLKANAAGHEYIKEQILNALDVSVYVPEETGLKGDVNLDGKVDMTDAIRLLRHTLGIELLTDSTALANGEVTGNTTLDMQDCIKILRYYLGIINTLD